MPKIDFIMTDLQVMMFEKFKQITGNGKLLQLNINNNLSIKIMLAYIS